MPNAKWISLSVNAELKASHSLAGFETPHYHRFLIEVEFRASHPIPNDRLIDLVFLKSKLDEVLAPFQCTYMNESLPFSPTSENVCIWLWDQLLIKLPATPLYQISVSLTDLQGNVSGTARLSQ